MTPVPPGQWSKSVYCVLRADAGDQEPVSVDSRGAKVLQQGTCVVEQRVQLDGRDCILRCVSLRTLTNFAPVGRIAGIRPFVRIAWPSQECGREHAHGFA